MDALSLLRTLGALGLVLGLLVGALWLVRRHDLTLPQKWLQRLGGTGPERRLQLVERLALDQRRSVVVVRRDEAEFTLVLAPEGCVVLDNALASAARPAAHQAPAQTTAEAKPETPAQDAPAFPGMPAIRFAWEAQDEIPAPRRMGPVLAKSLPKFLTMAALVAGTAALVAIPDIAHAQAAAQSAGAGIIEGSMSSKVIQMLMVLTVLSLAPGILMTITSFTRIVVALSLLRSGLGVQGVPPNPVVISLAMFLSFFVMAPTFDTAWKEAMVPYNAGQIDATQALEKGSRPFHAFMLKQVRDDDVKLFISLSGKRPASRAEIPMTTLMPAFMISELRRAFEIGFLLLLPFLVIDLAVSAVLMAMGMMMLPPATISLPMKIIFFVLVDGWALVAGSLVKSFGAPG